ncbi:MAG: ComF family protein [Chromatiaceae bacterium]|nr:ComF family protein [Candidatus Thioaporhodococcus sediminis]
MLRPCRDRPLIAALLPPTCALCGAPGARGLDICAGCRAELPLNPHACPRCALPLAISAPPGLACGTCQRQPPPYAVSHIPFLYRDTMASLIRGAKFHGKLNLARLLGLCLAQSVRGEGIEPPEVIIPVPLHPRRLRQRGYNQALEIARTLSRELAIPVDAHSCVRLRSITPQEGLDKEARRQNVRGAFGVERPLRFRHLVILDDVVTTGSTAAEVARVLLAAGAHRVDLWALARTP